MAKRGRPATRRPITSGGVTQISEERRRLDIVLQSPEIFHFDIAKYMQSLESASAIDMYNRSRLYDIYSSVLLDLHLSGIIEKRLRGVTRIPIAFRRDGKLDDVVNDELKGPWFRQFLKDILWSKFWGFSLFQFYRDASGRIAYDLVDRKHYDPVRREILRYETDSTGIPVEEFSNVLCVAESQRGLGLLAKLAPMVLYKRGNMGDWAEFCQVFGMPIREYVYDAGDETARQKLLKDARCQGGNAVYIHPKDSDLRLIESGNKTGSADLYERFAAMCNTEMSVAVLGNTLTTDAKATGTQALGKVHQEEENEMKDDDRDFVIDVLNYHMTEIFAALGVDTSGGEFVDVTRKQVDKTVQITVVEKLSAMGLPISDDYLYDTFDIDKPQDYEAMKAEQEARAAEERRRRDEERALIEQRLNGLETVNKDGKSSKDSSIVNRLKGFFVSAPQDGAPLEF